MLPGVHTVFIFVYDIIISLIHSLYPHPPFCLHVLYNVHCSVE